MTTPELIIFTDLDGTLLDRDTYSFEGAQAALDLVKQKGIPLILTSSKTRAEIELVRRQLKNDHPFISENGGAVFIPKGYFPFSFPHGQCGEYSFLELGTPYSRIVEILDSIGRETGIAIKGFSNLAKEDLASLSGMSMRNAELSKQREYDEPFLINGGEMELKRVMAKIKEKGMSYTWGGRFHHIHGKNDKGKAVTLLKKLYANQYFSVTSLGIGDSQNDLPMLLAVDHPIFLKGEQADVSPPMQGVTLIEGNGPHAWNRAILNFIG